MGRPDSWRKKEVIMSPAAIQAAVGIGQSLTGYMLAKQQHKSALENQRHRNAILDINTMMQLNDLELQEIDLRNISRDASKSIQLQTLQQEGVAEVSAAAAGVAGGSVEAVMRGIKRNSMLSQARRIEDTSASYRKLGKQRQNININRILGEDRTVIPGPTVGGLLLSMGTAAAGAYADNTSFGDTKLGGFFKKEENPFSNLLGGS